MQQLLREQPVMKMMEKQLMNVEEDDHGGDGGGGSEEEEEEEEAGAAGLLQVALHLVKRPLLEKCVCVCCVSCCWQLAC